MGESEDRKQLAIKAGEQTRRAMDALARQAESVRIISRPSPAELAARELSKSVVIDAKPLAEAARAAGLVRFDPAIMQFIDSIRDHQQMMRAALGPLEDLRKLTISDQLVDLGKELSVVRSTTAQLAAEFAAQFRLPEMNESMRLMAQIAREAQESLAPLRAQSAQIVAAMESMRQPWLDMHNAIESARGFAGLQSIGASLAELGAFDDSLSATLREHIGDWRDEIVWPEGIADDIGLRSAFYEERGLDPALTDFPAPSFEEAVTIARLRTPLPRIIEVPDYDIPPEQEHERPGYERTNAAHKRLLYFERQLRGFIDRAMTQAYGENWIRQRVHGDTRKLWQEGREREIAKGIEPGRLIDYADFTDYEPLIIRGDHWDDVFRPVFGRKDAVRESFQRLYPIRLCTMHARLITQDDDLLLYIEVKRILKAIGVLKVQ